MDESALPWALRILWALAISGCILGALPLSIGDLVRAWHKRGKLTSSSTSRFLVPQRFFAHFYIVGVAWTTILLISSLAWSLSAAPTAYSNLKVVLALILMEAQVLRRLYESYCVFKYDINARMHVIAYITGIFYYIGAPLSLCSVSAGRMLSSTNSLHVEMDSEKVHWKVGWPQWIGIALASWGWIHQRRCHAILASLRSNKTQQNENHIYGIPRGDWFEMVSSAHYFAEIVIYAGLAICCGDLTAWFLFGWVVANLSLTAVDTHAWYVNKFEDYPRTRRAIIPFIC